MADGDLHIGAMAQRFAAADSDPARTPPHNIEAEQALLGALLMNNDAADRVGFLRAGQFYEPVHGRIFEVATTMIRRGQVADAVTCKTYFEADGALAEIGGAQYLAHLAAAATPLMSVEHYGRLVHDLATRRAIIRLAGDAMERAENAGIDDGAADMLNDLRAELDDVVGRPGGGPVHISAALASAIQSSAAAYKRGDGLAGLPFGFRKVDAATGGMCPEELIVLAGDTGEGKSALALYIALKTAMAGHTVLVCSHEMRPEEHGWRLLAAESGIQYSRQRRGAISQPEWSDIVAASRRLQDLPILIDETCETPGRLVALARSVKRQQGLGLIVVDYLQLLRSDRETRGDTERFADVTRALKMAAKTLSVPILALSQYSRERAREKRRPRLTDLYGGQAIPQNANTILMIYREAALLEEDMAGLDRQSIDYDNVKRRWLGLRDRMELIVGKARAGAKGPAMIRADLALNRFGDLEGEVQSQGAMTF